MDGLVVEPPRPSDRHLAFRGAFAGIAGDSWSAATSATVCGFKPKMIGGAMVGLQATRVQDAARPVAQRLVNYETWVPSEKM